MKDEIFKLDKEVEELTKDANEKKSDPKSYDEYKNLLSGINAKLNKEKNDLVFISSEKDKKLLDIKKKIEQIEQDKEKLSENLEKNQRGEDEKKEELEKISEEVSKLSNKKTNLDTKI